MFDALQRGFDATHSWLFDVLVQPLLFAAGAANWLEDAYPATEWFLLGVVQIALLFALLRPLEAWFPAERWQGRRGVGVDIIYTALHRLGAFALLVFTLLRPFADGVAGQLRGFEFTPWDLDALWPGVTDVPIVGFLLYLVALDAVDYGLHRAQHRLRWWWALHALHHSQRKMSFWTDDRNHLLDSLILDAVKAAVALTIGVEPAQFVGLIIATRLLKSVQHANVAWTYGVLGYVLVSPMFHRRHHAIGVGHEGRYLGCNFAVLFPVWDMVFGTAEFHGALEPTGIRDQLPPPQGRGHDYGEGFWRQQWLGLKRMVDPAA